MIHTVHLHVLYISYLRLMILNISWVCTTFSRGFPLLVPCSTSSWLIFSQSEKVTGRAPLSEQRHEERLRVHALGGAPVGLHMKCPPNSSSYSGLWLHIRRVCSCATPDGVHPPSVHALSCVFSIQLKWLSRGCTG